MDLGSLPSKVEGYKKILSNTVEFRKMWNSGVKSKISDALEIINKETELSAKVEVRDNIENLEAVVLDLGRSSSGLYEHIEDSGVKRVMIKSNGALIYQQLFNGKIMVMTLNPSIEGYGEAKPPKMLEILKPDEIKEGFIIRHVETLMKEITEWEDYDDDNKKKESFNPIGFQTSGIITEE